MTTEVIHGDRRADRRYQLELALHFHYTDESGAVCFGSGLTVELSRGGIRFQTDDPPPTGADLEMHISWPFLLQGICPLELVATGRVLSTSDHGAVLRMKSYEFRTRGERSFCEMPQPSGASLVV